MWKCNCWVRAPIQPVHVQDTSENTMCATLQEAFTQQAKSLLYQRSR